MASPSGVLRLDGTGAGSLTVTVPEGALRGWSESALEREIVALVDAAIRAARRVYVQARREFLPTEIGPTDDDLHGPETATRHQVGAEPPRNRWRSQPRVETFREAVNEIPVEGVSQRGYVRLRRDADHQFHARVRRGALGRLRENDIGKEIGSALIGALGSYNTGYSDAYRSAFGSDPGFSEEERPAWQSK